jgi:predicted phosphohydrolase
MKRTEAAPDLAFLAALPGIKIAIKGNHDYWWESDKPIGYPGLFSPPKSVDGGWWTMDSECRASNAGGELPAPSTDHSPLTTNFIGFAGTRGWNLPDPDAETYATDKKTFERERRRLQKSLEVITDCRVKIALLHYPPQPFLDILTEAGVVICVYGHVHVNSLPNDEKLAVFGETLSGVTCYCVACDRVGFTPVEIYTY